jgi:FkbM family methyltransferase
MKSLVALCPYVPEVVVDFGAYIGQFSIFSAMRGSKFILAYEPDPNPFYFMVQNIYKYKFSTKIFPFPYAITGFGEPTWTTFRRLKDLCPGSLHFKKEIPSFLDDIQVPTLPLNHLYKSLNYFPTIDYLKVDVEGAEWDIFFRPNDKTATDFLNKVRFLAIEFHFLSSAEHFDYPDWNSSSFDYAIDYLKSLNFTPLLLERKKDSGTIVADRR